MKKIELPEIDLPEVAFPSEWYPQSGVQLTWPDSETDWAPVLDEVIPCFVSIAREIVKREKLLVVCRDETVVRRQLHGIDESRVVFCPMPINDTWARDHGGISVFENGKRTVFDFQFNGWGLKYPANHDNRITANLFDENVFAGNVRHHPHLHFVLEGGSIETDGKGTLLTTENCLTAYNRNDLLSMEEIEFFLKVSFGLERVLWLGCGPLAGDDTDGHIDTLVRFCNESTIAYVRCTDKDDEHYRMLQGMEDELKAFRQLNGEPYELIPLPMADRVEWEGRRLPATYANFLIINGAVLMPFYRSPRDETAKAALQYAFPGYEVIGIDCLPLLKQNGSLHCMTMQYPQGFLK